MKNLLKNISLLNLLICLPCLAFDVDDADSLDFESFHKKKEDSITLFDDKTKQKKETSNKGIEKKQSKLIVSARYSLTRSDKTPYSAFYVIEALHKNMAQECPEGWTKEKEWSTYLEDQDFELHYHFKCL